MRFNELELIRISKSPTALEGILHCMKISSDWSYYYQQQTFKERKFRLVNNLLFYYRLGETEPLGVLVLEQVHVAYEQEHPNILFAFSLSSADGKHILACKCQDDVNKWVTALKKASYQHMRTQYLLLQAKIGAYKGRRNIPQIASAKVTVTECTAKLARSSFYTSVVTEERGSTTKETKITQSTSQVTTTGNLIDL